MTRFCQYDYLIRIFQQHTRNCFFYFLYVVFLVLIIRCRNGGYKALQMISLMRFNKGYHHLVIYGVIMRFQRFQLHDIIYVRIPIIKNYSEHEQISTFLTALCRAINFIICNFRISMCIPFILTQYEHKWCYYKKEHRCCDCCQKEHLRHDDDSCGFIKSFVMPLL